MATMRPGSRDRRGRRRRREGSRRSRPPAIRASRPASTRCRRPRPRPSRRCCAPGSGTPRRCGSLVFQERFGIADRHRSSAAPSAWHPGRAATGYLGTRRTRKVANPVTLQRVEVAPDRCGREVVRRQVELIHRPVPHPVRRPTLVGRHHELTTQHAPAVAPVDAVPSTHPRLEERIPGAHGFSPPPESERRPGRTARVFGEERPRRRSACDKRLRPPCGRIPFSGPAISRGRAQSNVPPLRCRSAQ